MLRRLATVALLIVVALALLAPSAGAQPPKRDPYSCGGAWTREATCTFRSTGTGGLGLSGWATGPGLTRLVVTVTRVRANGTRELLGECVVAGLHTSGCGQVWASSDDDFPAPRGTVLTCRVQGSPGGRYSCSG